METELDRGMYGRVPFVLTVPMRNGNNSTIRESVAPVSGFLPYLWGMETFPECDCQILYWVRSYRTYEEWKPHSSWQRSINVLSSYRTYEEWKPTNIIFLSISYLKFLPYLWGMETEQSFTIRIHKHSSYRTYEEWKLPKSYVLFQPFISVLTVPMRNGNFSKNWYAYKGRKVLTVPMRNGNRDWEGGKSMVIACSYRTYEEWKQVQIPDKNIVQICSYRTYEEWKQRITWKEFLSSFDSSYRTYEEWKQTFYSTMTKEAGSSSYRTYEEWKLRAKEGWVGW